MANRRYRITFISKVALNILNDNHKIGIDSRKIYNPQHSSTITGGNVFKIILGVTSTLYSTSRVSIFSFA